MSNTMCPICALPTTGKQVRDVNFCDTHRKLAINVRDNPEVIAKYKDNPPRGDDFIKLVRAVVVKANQMLELRGQIVMGTDTQEKIKNILSRVAAGTLLKVTFKREAAADLQYVLGMIDNGILSTPNMWDRSAIYTVSRSNRWENVDRSFTFKIDAWGEREKVWFLGRLGRAIENLEIQF